MSLSEREKEAQLFSMLNLIADKHGMKIEIKDDVINLVGDCDRATEIACAFELDKVFGKYADII